MATAAAASTGPVTGSRASPDLYWDSHADLLRTLDKYGAKDNLDDQAEAQLEDQKQELANKLKEHFNWLLNGLSCFKLPSSASRTALDSSKVPFGSGSLEVRSDLKPFALAASSRLCLDEVQAYILVERFLEEDYSGHVPHPSDETVMDRVALYYSLERQCLLKSQCVLLTFHDTEASLLGKFLATEAAKLLQEDLEGKTWTQLKAQLAATPPSSLTPGQQSLYAEALSMEQGLLLRVLFMTYFMQSRCDAQRLLELAAEFQKSVFGEEGVERAYKLALTSEASQSLEYVQQMAALLLIEGLDFETLLGALRDNNSLSSSNHSLAQPSHIDSLDAIFSTLDPAACPAAGPLLLMWAVFLGLLPSFKLTASAIGQASTHATKAFEAKALEYLVVALKSEAFQDDAALVTAQKSIVKTALNAFLAAYNVNMDNEVDAIVDLLCEVFKGQPELCSQYWEVGWDLDQPLRRFTEGLKTLFPHKCTSLLQVLAALCEGAWPAECVYDYLYHSRTITFRYSFVGQGNQLQDVVYADGPLHVPLAPGLWIPRGTVGKVLSWEDQGSAVVQWNCSHHGLLVLLFRAQTLLQRTLTSDSLSEVSATVALLDRILTSAPVTAHLLLDLNHSSLATSAWADGRLERGFHFDAIFVLSSLLHLLSTANVLSIANSTALPACLRAITALVPSFPQRVVENLGVLGGEAELLKQGLASEDQRTGVYQLTLAYLDLVASCLKRGVFSSWVMSLTTHIITDILSQHRGWGYQRRHDRWQIATKAMNVAQLTFEAGQQPFSAAQCEHLTDVLFDSLMNHTGSAGALLSILSTGAQGLEELHYLKGITALDIEWVEKGIAAALQLLSTLLRHAYQKNLTHWWPLEQVLFRGDGNLGYGANPPVAAVASYLHYPDNEDITKLAMLALQALCFSAKRARPRPLGLTSYLVPDMGVGDEAARLQTVLAKALSPEGGANSPEVFERAADLLTVAAEWQPNVVELVLMPGGEAPGGRAPGGGVPGGGATGGTGSEGLDSLLEVLKDAPRFLQVQPSVLSRALFVLLSLWQGSSDYQAAASALASQANFSPSLGSLLSSLQNLRAPSLDLRKHELLAWAFRMRSEASILRIMAEEVFARQTSESWGFSFLKDWGKGTAQTPAGYTKRLAICLFEPQQLTQAKAEARALVVGLLARLSAGEYRGLSASLVEELSKLSQSLMQQPALQQLVEHYSSLTGSQPAQATVLSDLYHHIQGEVQGGRAVPAGPFQELAAFLARAKVEDFILKPPLLNHNTHPPYGDDFCIETTRLEGALNWADWEEGGPAQALPGPVAEESVRTMRRVNAICALADAQLAALQAWAALYTVASSMQISEALWPKDVLETSISELLQALSHIQSLQASLQSLDPYLTSFKSTLASLLFSLTRSWVRLSDPTDQTTFSIDFAKQLLDNLRCCTTDIANTRLLLSTLLLLVQANVFSNPSLTLELLPLLCTFSREPTLASLALASVKVLVRRGLDVYTWVPILEEHLKLDLLLSEVGLQSQDRELQVGVLGVCLELARCEEASAYLHRLELLQHLTRMSRLLLPEASQAPEGPFSVSWDKSKDTELPSVFTYIVAILGSCIRSAQSLGSAGQGEVVTRAVDFVSLQSRNLLGALHVPPVHQGPQGWGSGAGSVRFFRPRVTLLALQEAARVAFLLAELAGHKRQWLRFAGKESLDSFSIAAIRLLAYIARTGAETAADTAKSARLSLGCTPVTPEEQTTHRLPSQLSSRLGWFLLTARGSSDLADSPSATEYTDRVAETVYELAELLLRFLSQLVVRSFWEMEERGEFDLRGVPELPAPGVLQALQDQALAIAAELAPRKSSVAATRVVRLMVSITEKAVFLEACVARTAGLDPTSLRAEDFRAALRGAQAAQLAEKLLVGLQKISAILYPGMTF